MLFRYLGILQEVHPRLNLESLGKCIYEFYTVILNLGFHISFKSPFQFILFAVIYLENVSGCLWDSAAVSQPVLLLSSLTFSLSFSPYFSQALNSHFLWRARKQLFVFRTLATKRRGLCLYFPSFYH